MKNLKEFNYNLNLTKNYCSAILKNTDNKSNAEILRSINLKENDSQIFDFKKENLSGKYTNVTNWYFDPINYKSCKVNDLLNSQLDYKKLNIKKEVDLNQKGKILLTQLDDILYEGFCEVVSEGFIDVYDLPPIDTWFFFDKNDRVLYSWIPNDFTDLMNDVMPCSSTDIYDWLEE